MTDSELKKLKDNLWHSADVLRAGAHLAANKYGQPILGLIFLRYADILFKQHKDEIETEYNKFKGGRMEKSIKEIAIEKCGFFLPECAYYDFINDAPDDANKATIVKKAMEAIEDENPKMLGVLPKEVYAQLVPEEEPELLSNIVRIFKDNVFTHVDRAHRKFSDEQIKNLGIITKLYNGNSDAFAELIAEYETALAAAPEESDDKEIKTKSYWQEQINWLTERFPDGEYRDVIGLCKAAPIEYGEDNKDDEDGIKDQDYSLNAGRYVGVVIEDDGMTEAEFKDTMLGLNKDFEDMNAEAKALEEQIADNIKALFGE